MVPGQVEDDASILKGAGEIRTNLALLQKVRAENPEAVILYKPHPDVEAGLRAGRLDKTDLADLVQGGREESAEWILIHDIIRKLSATASVRSTVGASTPI